VHFSPIKFARLSYPVSVPFIFFRTERSERRKMYRRASKRSWVHPMYRNLRFQYLVSSEVARIAEPSHLTIM
jgi:hypothetical protein